MSDTFYTTTHGDTRAQALDAAKMQAAIYFVDEPFDVTLPPRDTQPVYVEDAVALLDVIAPDDAEVLREYLNGGRP